MKNHCIHNSSNKNHSFNTLHPLQQDICYHRLRNVSLSWDLVTFF
jgi:hypothetical protein